MIDAEEFNEFDCEGWHGWVRHELAEALTARDPWQTVVAIEHAVVRNRPAVTVVNFAISGQNLYAKHTVAPNDAAAEGFAPGATLKWLARGSQAVRVLRITRQMQAAGLNCPDPVLAARQRHGLHAEDLYISRAVEGQWFLIAWRDAPDHGARDQLINRAGEVIAQFHAAGFLHGDLGSANLITSADMQRLTFIDNDRTMRWPGSLPMFLRKQNLLQFLFGFRLLEDAVLERFIRAYCNAAGYGRATQHRFINVLIPKVRARAAKRGEAVGDWTPPWEKDEPAEASADESKVAGDR